MRELKLIPQIDPVAQTHKYIRTLFCNQVALNANEDLKFSNPDVFIKSLKQKHNLFIDELIKKEPLYDELFYDKRVENQMDHMYRIVSTFADKVSAIPLHEMGEFAQVAEAFIADKRSVLGISQKVLKHKTSHL